MTQRDHSAKTGSLWPVGDYEIAGRKDARVLKVRLRRGRIRTSAPLDHPELLETFGYLSARNQEQEILSFAKRYGHLGYNHLIPASRRCGGEPVSWIWSHVRTVHTCLTLTAYLRDASMDVLKKYVRQITAKDNRFGVGSRREKTRFILQLVPDDERLTPKERWRVDGQWDSGDPRPVAQWIRRVLINHNLQTTGHVCPQVTDEGVAYEVVPTLLAVIYRHLVSVVDNREARLCASTDCDKVFLQKRQQVGRPQCYHSETCSARERKRNSRKKKHRQKKLRGNVKVAGRKRAT